jgi:membrane protein DedA with SNARE-associated domain
MKELIHQYGAWIVFALVFLESIGLPLPFRRQGMAVVLIARFVAVLRSVIGFIAGANRMPFANFMIASSAGAVAWALFYGLAAYYLGKGVEELARPFALALAVVGAIVKKQIIMIVKFAASVRPGAPDILQPIEVDLLWAALTLDGSLDGLRRYIRT